MKKLFVILLVMVILFASCERKSGRRSPSGQRAAERARIESQFKTDANIKVKVISEPERILVETNQTNQTNQTEMFKVKVLVIKDSTVCFVLLSNKFEIGDIIEIKPTQRIVN